MTSRAIKVLAVALLPLLGAGCQVAKRVVRPVIVLQQDPQERVFSHLVRADGDGAPERWDFAPPHRLRPCCAFGSDIGVKVGVMPISGLRLDNVVQANDLGHHKYNSGIVSIDNPAEDGFISPERNGLVYTCRASFIDTAHIRDYADLTVYLAGRIDEAMKTGASFEMPPEGGERVVHVAEVKPDLIQRVGRRELVIKMAQWAAIQLAIWHEAATWYGWSSIGIFPETASAFSPEDLYSNLVGIMLASELIRAGLADNVAQYETGMDVAMPEVLKRLRAAPSDVTRAAIHALDGRWWNSNQLLPDKHLLLRRNFDIGPEIRPWTIPATGTADAEIVRDYCERKGDGVLTLRYPTKTDGEMLRYLVRIEVRPAPALSHLQAHRMPDGGWIAQEEFPAIVRRAHLESIGQFGMDSDKP